MTLHAGHSGTLPDLPGCVYPVDNGCHPKLFVFRTTLVVVHRIPMKSGSNQLVVSRIWEEVSGELFNGELIEWHVVVKRTDDPIAISPDGASCIALVSFGIGVSRHIEPPRRPLLAKPRRGEQLVYHAFVGILGIVVDKRCRLFRIRRQANKV